MPGGSVLSGSLEFLTLGDILQLLGSNGSTGVLRLTSPYAPDPAAVYLRGGNPVNAENGALTGLEAIHSLFGWCVGRFEFSDVGVTCETVIKQNRMNIILDGLTMLDEGTIEKLGPVTYDGQGADRSKKDAKQPTIHGPMIDYMYVVDEESFESGREITVEGKHGNWIWVILEGTVDILKKAGKEDFRLLRVTEGAFLGSTASFLIGGNVRGATAVAATNVQLGVLDLQRLTSEFSSMSPPLKGLVIGLDRRLRGITETVLDLRRGIDRAEGIVTDQSPVMAKGDEEGVFTLTAGEAHVIGQARQRPLYLAKLVPNDVFGRIPFIDIGHEPASAAVFGSEDLKFQPLNLETLAEEHDGLSTTLKNLLEYIGTSIAVTTRLAYDYQRKIKPSGKQSP